jgi:hypothetical protein
MTDPLYIPSLPGSIPRLLDRGSPVLLDGTVFPATVTGMIYRDDVGSDAEGRQPSHVDCAAIATYVRPLSAVALDLSEATGRAHAAWWARSVEAEPAHREWLQLMGIPDNHTAVALAEAGYPMTAQQIDILRRMCLRLADLLEAP